jgi:N-acetylneuraminic acid mutarotase
MSKIISVFLFFFCIQSAFTQGAWTQLSDIPSTGRHHACAFVLGDSAYIVTGSDTDDFFKYDIHTDSWTQLANFPGGNRTYSIGFSVNGKGYLSCGYDGSTANMEMWEYDPILDAWTQKTSGPAIGRIHPAFSVVGDRVFLGQGQQNGNFVDLDDWYEYNTVTDVWTQKSNFMSPRHHGTGATVGNTVYVGTGHHLGDMFSDWYAYDAAVDTWQTMTGFPGDGRSAANSVSANGKVYFFGGEDEINFARFDDFWEYDPTNDTWGSLTTFPADGRWAPFMFVHNDTIYAGAGQDEVMVNRKDLWRFDFSSVGINEQTLPVISVFPNPSNSGYFKINSNTEIERVDIIDVLGRSFSVPFDASSQQVDASELSSGKYMMRISATNQHVMNKNVPIIILK